VAFSAPIGRAAEIPPIVSQMMMVGEQTGKLDAILATLAQFYNEETNTRIKTLSSIIEPVVIIIMGLGVAFVVFAVMLPIYQASQNLSTGGGAAGV
jgi:general secretion pathway protein F